MHDFMELLIELAKHSAMLLIIGIGLAVLFFKRVYRYLKAEQVKRPNDQSVVRWIKWSFYAFIVLMLIDIGVIAVRSYTFIGEVRTLSAISVGHTIGVTHAVVRQPPKKADAGTKPAKHKASPPASPSVAPEPYMRWKPVFQLDGSIKWKAVIGPFDDASGHKGAGAKAKSRRRRTVVLQMSVPEESREALEKEALEKLEAESNEGAEGPDMDESDDTPDDEVADPPKD
jgi:hypothetical protein